MPRADVAPRFERGTGPPSDAGQIRWAVICAPHDASGPWICSALRRRGFLGLRLVSTEEVVYSTRLTHRLNRDGVSTEVTLSDGGVLGPHLRGVVNRVVGVPAAHLAGATEADREYATSELYALLTSLLAGLPGVVLNRAGPRGLPGPWLRPAEWLVHAGRVGLPGVGYRSTQPEWEGVAPDHSVLVVGDTVIPVGGDAGGTPEPVATGCRALSRRVGAPLLGLDFVEAGSGWLLAGANPTPDLRPGGERAADGVAALLNGDRSP